MVPSTEADSPSLPESRVAEEARTAWDNGAVTGALDMLTRGIHEHPQTQVLRKLRGDILATIRRPLEALQAYEEVLAKSPAAIEVRWAKWSVLLRAGHKDDAVAELQRIASYDPHNPLIHLRLAQELRKLDRLEESLDAYKNATSLAPDMLGWRLAMARARFDVLDYRGAEGDVQELLRRMPPGSALDPPAKTLLSQIQGYSMERGRRFIAGYTSEISPERRKDWAALRADAWRLFTAGRYEEAEPLYQRLLALNPKDPTAVHQLGLILMQLGRCREALNVFGKMATLDASDEDYTDTVFRIGHCLVELERWEEALGQFQLLYDAAVDFEENNQGVPLPAGMRVLDKQKLLHWIEKIRPHVPEAGPSNVRRPPAPASADTPAQDETALLDELRARAIERLKPQASLNSHASLMGRDSDFSWFRFVIPAAKVMRDDNPTGEHDFIPIDPADSFATTQPEIYLAFGLVSASYDAVPLTARCFLETEELAGEPPPVAHDQVVTSMSDQSGYFRLGAPPRGWAPGLYRCALFAGDTTSAYNHVDEVRFRIVQPAR